MQYEVGVWAAAFLCFLLAILTRMLREKVGVVASVEREPDGGETQASVRNFKPVVSDTLCLYARKSLIWGHQEGESLGDVGSRLESFCTHVRSGEPLDGFVIELLGAGRTLPEFTASVAEVLLFLSEHDPGGAHCLSRNHRPRVHERGWVFKYARVELFLTTFGPCYDDSSPRWSAGVDSIFILFQPYESFFRHDIDCLSPLTKWDSPRSSRDKIRKRFKSAGRPYNTANDATTPHAYDVVRPQHLGEALVEWWDYLEKDAPALASGDGTHPDLSCSGSLGIPSFQLS